MTIAVCIQCGAMKHGALTPCPECQFDPESNEDKAKSMIVTDHFLSEGDLDGISKRIQTGQPVSYPKDTIDEYIKLFEENPNFEKASFAFKIGCMVVIATIIALIAWAIIGGT